MKLSRLSFDCLIGGSDELFSYLQDRYGSFVYLGYDPLLNSYYAMEHPDYSNLHPCVKIIIKSEHQIIGNHHRSISIDWNFLIGPLYNNWVYRITFSPSSDADRDIISHKSFDSFRIGYVGMTSRHSPFIRFNEHFQKVRKGEGHLLHKAWAAIALQANVIVQLTIIACCDTRAKAFDVEEAFVDTIGSKAPSGLNVLSGGMKGIREMWNLGLLAKSLKPTDVERDAALNLLETDRNPVSAHYRTGHIRKLPAKCSAETTWVSPCWVGLSEVRK